MLLYWYGLLCLCVHVCVYHCCLLCVLVCIYLLLVGVSVCCVCVCSASLIVCLFLFEYSVCVGILTSICMCVCVCVCLYPCPLCCDSSDSCFSRTLHVLLSCRCCPLFVFRSFVFYVLNIGFHMFVNAYTHSVIQSSICSSINLYIIPLIHSFLYPVGCCRRP